MAGHAVTKAEVWPNDGLASPPLIHTMHLLKRNPTSQSLQLSSGPKSNMQTCSGKTQNATRFVCAGLGQETGDLGRSGDLKRASPLRV